MSANAYLLDRLKKLLEIMKADDDLYSSFKSAAIEVGMDGDRLDAGVAFPALLLIPVAEVYEKETASRARLTVTLQLQVWSIFDIRDVSGELEKHFRLVDSVRKVLGNNRFVTDFWEELSMGTAQLIAWEHGQLERKDRVASFSSTELKLTTVKIDLTA